jgi:DNA-binding SARP family transcriptional activator
LNVTLHGIRPQLQTIEDRQDIIVYESDAYFFNPDVALWLDVDAFDKAWREGQAMERTRRVEEALAAYSRASRLYAGDLMEDSPYEDWLALEREHLKEVYLVILDKLSRYCSLDGDPEGAISLCERMLEKDRCQEEVYRRLMLCYHRLGFRDKALKQYDRCAAALRTGLDVAPTTETKRLHDSIRNETNRLV